MAAISTTQAWQPARSECEQKRQSSATSCWVPPSANATENRAATADVRQFYRNWPHARVAACLFLIGKNRGATRACTASTRIWLSRSRCPAVCEDVRGNRRHTQNSLKIRPQTQGQRESNAKKLYKANDNTGGNRRGTRKKHKKT